MGKGILGGFDFGKPTSFKMPPFVSGFSAAKTKKISSRKRIKRGKIKRVRKSKVRVKRSGSKVVHYHYYGSARSKPKRRAVKRRTYKRTPSAWTKKQKTWVRKNVRMYKRREKPEAVEEKKRIPYGTIARKGGSAAKKGGSLAVRGSKFAAKGAVGVGRRLYGLRKSNKNVYTGKGKPSKDIKIAEFKED